MTKLSRFETITCIQSFPNRLCVVSPHVPTFCISKRTKFGIPNLCVTPHSSLLCDVDRTTASFFHRKNAQNRKAQLLLSKGLTVFFSSVSKCPHNRGESVMHILESADFCSVCAFLFLFLLFSFSTSLESFFRLRCYPHKVRQLVSPAILPSDIKLWQIVVALNVQIGVWVAHYGIINSRNKTALLISFKSKWYNCWDQIQKSLLRKWAQWPNSDVCYISRSKILTARHLQGGSCGGGFWTFWINARPSHPKGSVGCCMPFSQMVPIKTASHLILPRPPILLKYFWKP